MPNEPVETLDVELKSEGLSEYLNQKAKEYLSKIKDIYGAYLPDNKKALLDNLLLSDNIVVESDFSKYQEIHPNDFPTAHGGKVFNDQKIHIYEEMFKENKQESMESVMIHELFHYFIAPEYSDKITPKENSYLTEGLVDMYAIDFMATIHKFQDYTSNYASNVILMRENLASLGDDESKNIIVFNGTVNQIIENVFPSFEVFYDDLTKAKEHSTKYDKLIDQISSYIPDSKYKDSYKRSLMRLSAQKGLREALSIIKTVFEEIDPSTLENITMEEYKSFKDKAIKDIELYISSDLVKSI